MTLLATNTKLEKGVSLNWTTKGLSLAPANLSGKQLCPHRSPGCEFSCINTSGMGVFDRTQKARIARARFMIEKRTEFLSTLEKEINSAFKSAKRKESKLAVRLNVYSDLPWHNMIDMEKFPDIQFYDYTPNKGRMIQFLRGELPANYHLTFSRKENNQAECELIASMGGNIAVAFESLPASYMGKQVIDGDATDLRFLDPKGVIVGLKVKGKGKKDTSGFIVRI